MHALESPKPVKMTYQLNDECLNPQPIEKTKVSLATRVFSESTRYAMQYYIENGDSFAHWEGTLSFLNIIAKWWDILNVKTPSKSKRKRHTDFEKISKGNLETITFFTNIVHWIDQWKSPEKPGLTNQTFSMFKQTFTTMPLLAGYLLAEMPLEYVLTGKIQSDFLYIYIFRHLLIGVTCYVRGFHFIAKIRFNSEEFTYDGLTHSPHVKTGEIIGPHKVQNCMFMHATQEIDCDHLVEVYK